MLCFLFLSPTLPCEMPGQTLSEVKARVVRQQKERTDERIRELRCERRENTIRETVSEVRVRAREEQRVRTEERVQHWQKVELRLSHRVRVGEGDHTNLNPNPTMVLERTWADRKGRRTRQR